MALSAFRLRRPLLRSSAALLRAFAADAPRCSPGLVSSPAQVGRTPAPIWLVPSASFRSTPAASSPKKSTTPKPDAAEEDSDDDVVVDTIMFEGCDYKHWLITLDFPKDPLPPEEEMIETYVQTCALGLGCSIEEAKKKIYACSTTVYHGFQAIMSEEQSERFRGLPGVVFILPDSYIDPENKEYGGDKYIDGTIIYRPRRGGMQVRYPRVKPDPPKQ